MLLQNSDRTFQAAVSYAVGNGPISLQIGDVNGDGKPDLVVLNSLDSTISVLLMETVRFPPRKLTTIPQTALSLAAGNFNESLTSLVRPGLMSPYFSGTGIEPLDCQ